MKTNQISSRNFLSFVSVILVSVLLFLPSKMNAQAKADFSGTWSFNETKSNLGEGQGFRPASAVTVTTEGINMTVARVRTNQNGEAVTTTEKYTLDGKESVNTSQRGPSKTVATWSADGKTLTFVVTRSFERDGQTTEFKSSEIWTLTDAKTLSLTTVFNMQGEERKTTYFYDKK